MSIKKVVIAAAGQGTRMQGLTKDRSKHLIKVGSRPFLAYLLDNLVKAGYDDFVLVTGHRADLMEKFKQDYLKEKPEIKMETVNQFKILGPKEKIYGTACPLMCAKEIIGQNNFLYIGGDNFYSVRDLKLINYEDNFNYVSGISSESPEEFGVLKISGEFLQEIIEKPKTSVGNLINVSLYKFTPEVFEKIFQIKKSLRGEYEITDAVNLLAKENKVKVNELQDKECWIDFGRPEDIEKFYDFVKSENSKGK